MQHTSLTPDKELSSLIYDMFFYANMYGSYKLLKQSSFLAHPVHTILYYKIYIAGSVM